MILTRFCSLEEYQKFISGEKLINETVHCRDTRSRSSAKGFCFTEDTPEEAFKYLSGVVDLDICMVLDIPKEYLTPAQAIYRNPESIGKKYSTMMIKSEWCCDSYNNKMAKLISATPKYSSMGFSHRVIEKIIRMML